MSTRQKPNAQPIDELIELRKRIAELEASEAEHAETERVFRESEKKYHQLVETMNEGLKSMMQPCVYMVSVRKNS